MDATLQALLDREAIRDVALRYCRGVHRLDAALMKSAYWPDATDDHGAFKGNAHEFVEHCMAAHLRWEATGHCIFNHAIAFSEEPNIATGECYNLTWLASPEQIEHWYGRYLDRYERRGDEWRIVERVCVHEATNIMPRESMSLPVEAFRPGRADRGVAPSRLGP